MLSFHRMFIRQAVTAVALVAAVGCAAAPPAAAPTAVPSKPAAAPTNSAPTPTAAAAPQRATAGQTAATGAPKVATPEEWAQIVDAAKKEKLVLATMPGSADEQIVAAFKQAYPDIPVEHTGARPSELSPKVITEQKNGVYNWDVIQSSGTSNMNEVLLPAGAFEPLPPYLLMPDVLDDSKWGTGQLALYTSDTGPYILIHNLSVSNNLFVNRDVIPQTELKDMDGLMDPKYKGKIVVQSCTVPAQGLVTVLGIRNVKSDEWIRDLFKNQQVVFQENVRTVSEWVATGRYPIALGAEPQELARMQREGVGKNVHTLSADVGTPSASGIAVFKNAPHPNAAKVFVNWFLSREGQVAWVEGWRSANPVNSRRLDVPVVDPAKYPDYNRLPAAVWGMDSGKAANQALSAICKEASSQ